MKSEERRDFDKDSQKWDAETFRINLANGVAAAIIKETGLSDDMAVLDFGCGTGLLAIRLQPLVGKIIGADSSQGMLSVLDEKIKTQRLANMRTVLVDFEKGERLDEKFNLIVSSMVLHHIPDTVSLFRLWHEMLLAGGRLCFADLDTEDGSFHSDKTGVFHFGFNREHLSKLLKQAGFTSVRDLTATTVSRNVPDKGMCDFPVFLIVADK